MTTIALQPTVAHVWPISIKAMGIQYHQLCPLLSTEEVERAKRLTIHAIKERFVMTRGVLRSLLSRYIDLPPQIIKFTYNAHHKPLLAFSKTAVHFNLSHTHHAALIAVSIHPLGVDIETVGQCHYLDIAKRYFSMKENRMLHHLIGEEQRLAFYQLWSRKEALLKAMGTGLAYPLAQFTVSHHNQFETIIMDQQTWALHPLHIDWANTHEQYVAALATHPTIDTIHMMNTDAHLAELFTKMT